MNCRHCNKPLVHSFIDLEFAPPSNAYLSKIDLFSPEKYYPLRVKVCDNCWLVQTEDYAQADELFNSDYAYFSSTSISWLKHAKNYSEGIVNKLNLNDKSYIVEVASNDGYLLKNFVDKGIPCLGIEPTDSTAAAAEKLNIPVIRNFFGEELAQKLVLENKRADLIIGNNVYAHVPEINDFTKGLKILLKDSGTINLEFPHLLNLVVKNQFDTIYHEHFSYLSLYTVIQIFANADLKIYDVEKISTHGGSLRIYGCHMNNSKEISNNVSLVLEEELNAGLHDIETYISFQNKANTIKLEFLNFLLEQKKAGKKVAAYGAAAKGNTLMNFCGIKSDLIMCVYDAAESKQNKFMPGSHIPILSPENIMNTEIDYLIILPWNIIDEVIEIYKPLSLKGVKFVTAIPNLNII